MNKKALLEMLGVSGLSDTHKVEPNSRLKQKYGRKKGLLIEVGCKVSPQGIQSGDYPYEERGS